MLPITRFHPRQWVTEPIKNGICFLAHCQINYSTDSSKRFSEKSVITPEWSGDLADSEVVSEWQEALSAVLAYTCPHPHAPPHLVLSRPRGDGDLCEVKVFLVYPKLSWKTKCANQLPASQDFLFSLVLSHLLLPCLGWSLCSLKNKAKELWMRPQQWSFSHNLK